MHQLVAEYGHINVSEAQRLTGREWGTMKKLLMGLVDRNILERKGREDIDRDPEAHFVLKGSSKTI